MERMRNSRKHHMVFCVFAGRVDVELNEFAFSIGRGGMWQVPRGKHLSECPSSLISIGRCIRFEEHCWKTICADSSPFSHLGNWYGLRNPYDRPTRLFFAQGCYMHEEEAGQTE